MKKELSDLVRDRSFVDSASGCWLWSLSPGQDGYGKIKIKGRTYRAHRVAWEAFNGEIPEGMLVCHKCDQPLCVNPSHLFLGTPLDNMQDKVKKGRWRGGPACWDKSRIGAGHHNAKLDPAKVRLMRMLGESISPKIWAKEFGICKQTAISAINGRTWAHVK